MGYKAAVFDMDGTILDTLDDLWAATNAALCWAGYPERTREEVRTFVGNGAWKLIRRAVPAETPDKEARRVLDWYRPYYEAHSQLRTAPYPGIAEALAALRRAGMQLAVVSNKPHTTTEKLAAYYFPDAFDAVIGAKDGVAVKPAPDMLYEAMELLGVTAAEAVYVGDSEVDILTAKNAGLPCVSVAWGFRDEEYLRKMGGTAFAHDGGELFAALTAPAD